MSGQASPRTEIHGYVHKEFEAVRAAFAENFARRDELGAACCIYHQGEKVVDLWGGVRDKATGAPWEEDTMVLVFSATKGMAAMAMALAHSRGLLDYEERVCTYWPEFAQQGKQDVTVRQLLAHQAGLFAFDATVDKRVIADLDRLAAIMAVQKPAWEPGTRQAYHVISLGFYEGELLRRVDPQHRSLGQFFQDEIATPLGLDFYIRLPAAIPNSKLAPLDMANPIQTVMRLPFLAMLGLVQSAFKHLPCRRGESGYRGAAGPRAHLCPRPRSAFWWRRRHRACHRPRLQRFATGGAELGLSPATLAALSAPATPPQRGFYDECMKGELQFSLGFMKPSKSWPFGHPGAYGAPGAGGSLGYADPQAGIAYAYVTNRTREVKGDPRDIALRDALRDTMSARTPATA